MKRTLPRELDDLGGMRAARWFRESTAGQWDNFGPDAQGPVAGPARQIAVRTKAAPRVRISASSTPRGRRGG